MTATFDWDSVATASNNGIVVNPIKSKQWTVMAVMQINQHSGLISSLLLDICHFVHTDPNINSLLLNYERSDELWIVGVESLG